MKKPATLLLLIALLLVIALGGYLVVAAPAVSAGNLWLSKLLSSDGRVASVYSQTPLFSRFAPGPDHEELSTVDLETGQVRVIPTPSGHSRWRLDYEHNCFVLHSPQNSSNAPLGQLRPTRLTKFDSNWRTGETSSEFLFPAFESFTLVGNRFVVAVEGNRIHVLDSRNIDRGFKSIAAHGDVSYVFEIPQSDRFYHVHVVTPSGKTSAADPILGQVDVYQIDDHGTPTRITSWTVGAGGQPNDFYVVCNANSLFSLSPDLKRIEVRSVVDGVLESSFEIPPGLDPAGGRWSFLYALIAMETPAGNRFFDLERREWLPQPEGDYRLLKLSRDRDWIFYCDNGRWRRFKLYDRTPSLDGPLPSSDNEQVEPHLLGEFLVDRGAELYRLDSDRLVVLSDRHGFSIHLIDIPSGKTIRVIKPLGWVIPLLLFVVLGYAAWCIAWMITSARGGGWAWVDVLLVGGVPLLMLVARTVMRGDVFDISRLPVRFALGGAMAGSMLASVWIVFGKTRLSLRGTPIWIFTAFLLVLLGTVFAEQTWIVWHAVVCAVVPAIGLTLPMLVLRALGIALHRDPMETKSEKVAGQAAPTGRTVPLRDLFLLTVVASLLFASSRPIRDSTGHVFQMAFLLLPLLYAVMLGLTSLIVALNRRGWVFWTGVALVCAGVFFLCRESIVLFIHGRSAMRWIPDPTTVPALGACAIALFVYLIPYRLRGWRLGRRIEV